HRGVSLSSFTAGPRAAISKESQGSPTFNRDLDRVAAITRGSQAAALRPLTIAAAGPPAAAPADPLRLFPLRSGPYTATPGCPAPRTSCGSPQTRNRHEPEACAEESIPASA